MEDEVAYFIFWTSCSVSVSGLIGKKTRGHG